MSLIAATVFALAGVGPASPQTSDKVSTSRVAEAYANHNQPTMKIRVTDPAGARIPNARVTVLALGNRTVADGKTDGAGEFLSVDIAAGSYSVHVAAPPFKEAERRNIVVNSGVMPSLISIQLDLGEYIDIDFLPSPPLDPTPMIELRNAIPDQLQPVAIGPNY